MIQTLSLPCLPPKTEKMDQDSCLECLEAELTFFSLFLGEIWPSKHSAWPCLLSLSHHSASAGATHRAMYVPATACPIGERGAGAPGAFHSQAYAELLEQRPRQRPPGPSPVPPTATPDILMSMLQDAYVSLPSHRISGDMEMSLLLSKAPQCGG